MGDAGRSRGSARWLHGEVTEATGVALDAGQLRRGSPLQWRADPIGDRLSGIDFSRPDSCTRRLRFWTLEILEENA